MTTSIKHPKNTDDERYPALRIVLLLWKICIVIVAAASVITAIRFWKTGGPYSGVMGLAALAVGTIVVLLQWAFTELVEVIMDIEENTRNWNR